MLRKIADFVKKIFRMEPIPTTVNTLREALQSLEVARNHFEHCDPEFVDAAIFELGGVWGDNILFSSLQMQLMRTEIQ